MTAITLQNSSQPGIEGMGRLFRPIEIHRKFGIPRDRLYAAIHAGEIRYINLGTKNRPSYLIAEADLYAWLTSCAQGGQK